jgi:hypothetical protein
MALQHFLVRYAEQTASASVASLTEIIAADTASRGCAIRGQEDVSLAMGEICLAIETEGHGQHISDLVAAWQSHGLRIDNADSEVHELRDSAADDTAGEAK